jgi:hypothetical protein
MSSSQLDTIQNDINDIKTTIAEFKTSSIWIRGLVIVLVPFVITAVVYGIFMYSNQEALQNIISKHFDEHKEKINPTIESYGKDLIEISANDKLIKQQIKNIKNRIEEIKISRVEKFSSSSKRRKRLK